MPESRSRKKPQQADRRPRDTRDRDPGPNPVWFKPVMFGLMLLGLVWILVFYITQTQYPIPGIGAWNITIGFGIAILGFLMTTRWRS